MPLKKANEKADPELLRQLEDAEAADEPVEAVFVLGSKDGAPPDPDRVEELALELVERAQQASGGTVEDMNTFRYMASFIARAKPRLIRQLLEEPEIASGVANRQPRP
jgi:hypothetical protein